MESSPASPSTWPSPPLAALSIYQLAQLNCREQLLIDPLYWTNRHISLLQCYFENPSLAQSSPQSQTDFTDTPPNEGPSKKLIGYVKRLRSGSQSFWRDIGICGILADPGCPFTSLNDLNFYFDQRCIRTLSCIVFYLGDDPNAAAKGHLPPIAAFIDCSDIKRLRTNSFNKRYPRRFSKPTSSLIALQLKKIIPPEPLHDPYIVAVLISLAHQQRYVAELNGKRMHVDPFLSQVLVSNDKQNLHLFTADISSSFLHKLDFPALPPPGSVPPIVSIRHTMIPYTPFRTFRQRLLQHLLPTFNNHNN
ncbi:hypothetical protein F5884DRAFT_687643 [Xylogone sp. PMI_703]|nr:hypothetical protein F5884DRAFT_687643 [Xylogone sp. PMI_703]